MSNPKEMCVKRQSFNSAAEILKKGGEFHTAKLVKLPIFGSSFKKPFLKKASFALNVLLEQAKNMWHLWWACCPSTLLQEC